MLCCFMLGYLSLWEDVANEEEEEEEEREKRRAKTAPSQRRGWSQVRAGSAWLRHMNHLSMFFLCICS